MPVHTCFHCGEVCDCNEGYDDGCIGCAVCEDSSYSESDAAWADDDDESDSDYAELAYDAFCDPGDEDPAETDDEGSW